MRPRSADEQSASDQELLASFITGEREAFGELFARHQGHLWAVALRVCADPEDAADALQDGLLRAMRAAGQFQGRSQVSTWLHRIVTNSAIDVVRARHPRVGLDDLGEVAEPAAPGQGGWDTAIDVEQALSQLPAASRVTVYLVDYEGWSVADVAAALGVAPGTVKSRCARARARLAPLLAGYGNQPGHGNVRSTDEQATRSNDG